MDWKPYHLRGPRTYGKAARFDKGWYFFQISSLSKLIQHIIFLFICLTNYLEWMLQLLGDASFLWANMLINSLRIIYINLDSCTTFFKIVCFMHKAHFYFSYYFGVILWPVLIVISFFCSQIRSRNHKRKVQKLNNFRRKIWISQSKTCKGRWKRSAPVLMHILKRLGKWPLWFWDLLSCFSCIVKV